MKRIAFAFVAYLILRFGFDAVLMPEFLRKLASSGLGPLRDSHLNAFHMLAMLAHAILFVWLYALVTRDGAGSWRVGLLYGILTALLISLPTALHMYAMIDKPAANVVYPVLWTVVTNAIGGIVVAMIVDSGESSSAAMSMTTVSN